MVTESIFKSDVIGSQTTVRVADDSEATCTWLAGLVRQILGASAVALAASASEVWACRFRDRPLVALVNVHLDDRGGSGLLRQIKKEFPSVELVALRRAAGAEFVVTGRGNGLDRDFDTGAEWGEIIQALAR